MSRNLKNRVFTGVILACMGFGCTWAGGLFLPLMLIIFITFATNEFFRFLHRKNIYPHTLAVFLPAYAIPLLIYYEVPLLLPFALFFFFVCLLSVMRFPGSRHKPNFLAEATTALFAIVYLSILPSTLIPLRKMGFGYAAMPLILTSLYDISAYFTGSYFGKHKLAPAISPSKTWEGTIFAFVVVFPATFLLSTFWIPSFDFLDICLVTFGIGVMSIIGDLFESGMKREVDLKDASKIFPGHGGFLDRLDSLIFTIPFFYIYIMLQL